MELDTLRIFLRVIEHGGFRRAALALGVEQSVVSRKVKALETELGAALFERTAFGATPTRAGHRMAREAPRIFAAVEAAMAGAVDEAAEERRVAIGYSLRPPTAALRALLSAAREGGARSVAVVEDCDDALVARLASGGLDIAFTAPRSPPSGCCAQLALEVDGLALVSRSHPLAERTCAEIGELLADRLLYGSGVLGSEVVRRFLSAAGREADVGLPAPQAVASRDLPLLVAAGFGVAMTCEADNGSETAAIAVQVAGRPLRLELYALFRESDARCEALLARLASR